MDALYDGWSGLPSVGHQLGTLLGPLSTGEPGHYRRYDWLLGRYAETVVVSPGPLLVLEGVGSASGPAADLATVIVWVTAPTEERRRRGLARDGAGVAAFWPAWEVAEAEHFAEWDTPARADLVVDSRLDS